MTSPVFTLSRASRVVIDKSVLGRKKAFGESFVPSSELPVDAVEVFAVLFLPDAVPLTMRLSFSK